MAHVIIHAHLRILLKVTREHLAHIVAVQIYAILTPSNDTCNKNKDAFFFLQNIKIIIIL